jgi:PAS domain S-box-containing protein
MFEDDVKDKNKTKDQLIEELGRLRQRVADLEKAAMERDYAQEEWSVFFDALESSVNAVLITILEGRIVYVNLAFLSMFEYGEKSELLGRNAADLFDSEQIIKFTDVKAVIDKAKGETEEFTVRRKDGTTFLVQASSSNVTDTDGNTIGRMASLVDITEHKRVQEALKKSKK